MEGPIFFLGNCCLGAFDFEASFSEEKDNEMTIMQKIEKCDQVIVPPSTFNKEVPPAVDALIMKALRRDPTIAMRRLTHFKRRFVK